MTTPASYPTGANQAFHSGVSRPVNPGRSNLGSVTLDGGLQADSSRWDASTPHAVLNMAQASGTPADTDEAAALGGESVGNANDAKLAAQGMQRTFMRQAGQLGSNDNVA